jgi:hypothetical protein
MKTVAELDQNLFKRAEEVTGVSEKAALIRLGLQWLIACESAKKLASLGGTEPCLLPIPRRRITS